MKRTAKNTENAETERKLRYGALYDSHRKQHSKHCLNLNRHPVFTGLLGDNSDLGATVSTVVMTIVVLIFGEITPKTIAKEVAESYAVAISPVLKAFIFIFILLIFYSEGGRCCLTKSSALQAKAQ